MIQVTLLIIVFFGILRWLLAKKKYSKPNYLLISLIVQTFPFAYGYTYYRLLPLNEGMLGTFGTGLRLEIPTILLFILIIFNFHSLNIFKNKIFENKWLILLILMCLITLINPNSIFPKSSLIPLSFLLQFVILIRFLKANFDFSEIFSGIYDGLKVNSYSQLLLCIGYPILGIEELATMFYGKDALNWSLKREGFVSVLGTFGHPAILALFSFVSLLFFLSSYLNRINKRTSFILVLINAFIIFLTFSRTTWISLVIVIILVILIFNSKKNPLSISTLAKAIFLVLIFTIIFYFSPWSDLFLKSDSQEQYSNRFLHWALGFNIWEKNKFLGVGFNSHVHYLFKNFNKNLIMDPTNGRIQLDFFISNPIHNTHMIILVELGLIGIVLWLYLFINRIGTAAKYLHTYNPMFNTLNLTHIGSLIAIFIYGFMGWAPLDLSIISLMIFLSAFSINKYQKRILNMKTSKKE